MAFLDKEEQLAPPAAPARSRRSEDRPRRRRRQFVLRRLIGVLVGLAFVLVVVLAFRGCLEARKDRGITSYVTDVGTIMRDSQQRGEDFFDLLDGSASEEALAVQRQIQLLRGSADSLLDRAKRLDVPGELSGANDAVLLTLQMRRDALGKIADNVSRAEGAAERGDAIALITRQMATLYSSDVLYSQTALPEIQSVVESEGISAPKLGPGNFMPDADPSSPRNTTWLEQTTVATAFGQLTGSVEAGGEAHGLGLVAVTMGGIVLDPTVANTVPEGTREIEVQVQNQGDAEESDIEVRVQLEGQRAVVDRIATIKVGEIATARLALQTVPTAGSEATLEVVVEEVVGEAVTENNQANYTVVFG